MRPILAAILPFVIIAFAAAPAAAAVYDGTWKFDIKNATSSAKPKVYLLQGGTYSCSTCAPPLSVAADGAFHAIAGNPYYDEYSVRIVDDHAIIWSGRLAGRPTMTANVKVAPDGKSMTVSYTDTTATSGAVTTFGETRTRVAPAPAGAHLVSGAWVTNGMTSDDAGLLVTLRSAGDTLTVTSPTGVSYTATIGGPRAPVTGDPGWTGVTLARPAADKLVETEYRGDTVIGVNTYTFAADGRTARIDSTGFNAGPTSGTMVKQ